MYRSIVVLSLAAVLAAALVVGCAQQPDASPPGTPVGGSPTNPGADPEIEQALARLSPQDRALAEAQRICPVSEQPLGSMGTPVKVDVEGQTVFVCCAGCDDRVKADPDTYLAKLKKN